MKLLIVIAWCLLGIFIFRTGLQHHHFDQGQLAKERKELRILLLHRTGVGEKEASARIKTACEHLGWECYSCSTKRSLLEKWLFIHPLQKTIEAIQPDFTINFQSAQKHAPGINFISLSSGIHTYSSKDFDWRPYASFDGFLCSFQEIDFLQKKIESFGKPFLGMQWLFTCPKTSFTPSQPKTLFYCGSNWDKTRRGEKYKRLFSLLDQRKDLSIYGPPNGWKHTPRSYRSCLPFDGHSLIDAMSSAGIALILHSDAHIQGNAPTARIFEAAAASCTVISDKHPFVMKEFGDSVLYIDQEASSEEMHRQIEGHLDWIYAHPAESLEMARKCHQIFEERFTLEKQLLNLRDIYELHKIHIRYIQETYGCQEKRGAVSK